MMRSVFWGGVLAVALAASSASATESEAQLANAKSLVETKAQITSAIGKVLVNQGAGFVPVSGSESLKLGDKIFIGPEASASITYLADNCKIAAPAGRLLTVNVLSPCQDNQFRFSPRLTFHKSFHQKREPLSAFPGGFW